MRLLLLPYFISLVTNEFSGTPTPSSSKFHGQPNHTSPSTLSPSPSPSSVPSPSPTNSQSQSPSNSHAATMIAIAISVAIVVGILLILLGAYFFLRRRRRERMYGRPTPLVTGMTMMQNGRAEYGGDRDGDGDGMTSPYFSSYIPTYASRSTASQSIPSRSGSARGRGVSTSTNSRSRPSNPLLDPLEKVPESSIPSFKPDHFPSSSISTILTTSHPNPNPSSGRSQSQPSQPSQQSTSSYAFSAFSAGRREEDAGSIHGLTEYGDGDEETLPPDYSAATRNRRRSYGR